MRILIIPYALIALVGLTILSVSSYMFLIGPFGEGALVGIDVLILSSIGAMAGLIVLIYGGTKTARLVFGF